MVGWRALERTLRTDPSPLLHRLALVVTPPHYGASLATQVGEMGEMPPIIAVCRYVHDRLEKEKKGWDFLGRVFYRENERAGWD